MQYAHCTHIGKKWIFFAMQRRTARRKERRRQIRRVLCTCIYTCAKLYYKAYIALNTTQLICIYRRSLHLNFIDLFSLDIFVFLVHWFGENAFHSYACVISNERCTSIWLRYENDQSRYTRILRHQPHRRHKFTLLWIFYKMYPPLIAVAAFVVA